MAKGPPSRHEPAYARRHPYRDTLGVNHGQVRPLPSPTVRELPTDHNFRDFVVSIQSLVSVITSRPPPSRRLHQKQKLPKERVNVKGEEGKRRSEYQKFAIDF